MLYFGLKSFQLGKGPTVLSLGSCKKYLLRHSALIKVEALREGDPRDTGLKEALSGSVLSFGQIREMNTTEEWERGVPECTWGSEKDGGACKWGLLQVFSSPFPSGTIHTGGGGG